MITGFVFNRFRIIENKFIVLTLVDNLEPFYDVN